MEQQNYVSVAALAAIFSPQSRKPVCGRDACVRRNRNQDYLPRLRKTDGAACRTDHVRSFMPVCVRVLLFRVTVKHDRSNARPRRRSLRIRGPSLGSEIEYCRVRGARNQTPGAEASQSQRLHPQQDLHHVTTAGNIEIRRHYGRQAQQTAVRMTMPNRRDRQES